MHKKIPLGTAIIVGLLAVLVTFQITYLAIDNKYKRVIDEIEVSPQYTLYSKLLGVDSLFRQLYIGEINEEELVDSIIEGYIAGTGDTYAEYMNSEEFDEFMNDLGGELEGVGIVVVYNKEYMALEVAAVMPDSPAFKGGILPNDIIIGVDGIDVSKLGYHSAVAAISGSAGTAVNLKIARGDLYDEILEVTLVREAIVTLSVMHHMYDDGTNTLGIIKILKFNKTTPEQFKNAVEILQKDGAVSFVFDVRDNSGGELESVIEVLDYLLPEGPIIKITDAEGNETVRNSEAGELAAPMAVLVNGNTASAAELFAAALRDYNKAFLVGEQTYGKGSMQTIKRLADESALRVTYRMYSPPFSDNYDGIGLKPDYIVPMAEEFASTSIYLLKDSEDNQLQEAIIRLKNVY